MSQLHEELKQKKICRFCLTQQLPELSSIYSRDDSVKSSAPLPVQVMAIASIEVYSSDGMPSHVCSHCRLFFEHSYRFKQMCKSAETLLRQFEFTGQWPNPLPKPKIPNELIQLSMQHKKSANPTSTISPNSLACDGSVSNSTGTTVSNKSKPLDVKPRKILNSNPVDSPEPPVPMRFKKEKLDEETIIFLDKVENNEELSMDDVQRLIAAADDNPTELIDDVDPSPRTIPPARVEANIINAAAPTPIKAKPKPKLLNKSSMRILNKNAEVIVEPRFSAPTLKRDNDGNVAMVTEIIDPSVPYEGENEPDPIKSAEPIETDCFPCPHCERSFPLRQLRDIHMVNHSRQRSFQCPECEKSFFSKYDLQKHNLVHTGDRPYKCVVCDKAFTRSTLLHRHEKTHTDIPKYICIYCEKPFISKEAMEQHTQKHLKNRPFQCKICDKSFAFKQGVERHEVTHAREQPYPCQYCKQSFSTPSKLARHLTAHAGNRPYPCKFCSKSYLLSHHLTRHLRSHKNCEAIFLCGACDKVFKTRDDLIYHSAVHATKTLVCPLCNDGFADLSSVTQHIKDHAEGEAYACEFCDLLFMSAERLLEHTQSFHPEEMLAYSNSVATQQQEGDAETEFNNPENLIGLEQTIEDFLEDDPEPENKDSSSSSQMQVEPPQSTIKSNQPQILNQIVIKTNFNTSDDENRFKLNEDNIVAIGDDDADDNQPSAKLRKVDRPFAKKIIKVWKQAPDLKKPAEPHRKVPSKTKKITSPQTIPTEVVVMKKRETITLVPPIKKSTQPTITSVLNLLPKGVSIRRNTPSNESKTKTAQSPAMNSSNDKLESTKAQVASSATTSPSNKRIITRRSNETIAPSVSNKVEPKPNTGWVVSKFKPILIKPKPSVTTASSANTTAAILAKPVNQQVIRKSTVASTAVPINNPLQNAGVKTMKMMIGDKRVKVQKITVTKAEAAALTKDGRIQIKDGTMILSNPNSK